MAANLIEGLGTKKETGGEVEDIAAQKVEDQDDGLFHTGSAAAVVRACLPKSAQSSRSMASKLG
ncbi:hypothetical protein HNP98_003068 [Hymenobacter sp. 9A]|uniref:Uncharacterized protein n=1 Tax=Hymenobacter caeli TaxID=2735894 RepID=A0ABX2FSR3_9BACT|nr:hypothetical protein [Hymenobacter caeli]